MIFFINLLLKSAPGRLFPAIDHGPGSDRCQWTGRHANRCDPIFVSRWNRTRALKVDTLAGQILKRILKYHIPPNNSGLGAPPRRE
jgi:hypothetical protein